MSDITLDDELILEYLAECREHLARIEIDLLAIEEAGANIDEELVNRVFRAAHSIKGGAGFFDLHTIRELGHKTENVLDLIRSRQMTPDPEVIGILLMAFDKLRELVEDHKHSGEADIEGIVEALTTLTVNHLPESEKHSLDQRVPIAMARAGRLIEISAFDLQQARKGGKCIYLIEYDLIHDIQRRGKTPLGVMNSLMKSGTILETVLDLDSAGTLDDVPATKLLFEVLYATVLEEDLIGQFLDAPLERIHMIDKQGLSKRLAPEQPVLPIAPAIPAAAAIPVVPAPPPVALSSTGPAPTAPQETTIRLNVSLLDSLMTLAGELVLSRNQLNESLARRDERGIRSGAQRLSLVTSELQEAVAMTRMQPVGNLFGKFTRVVRDLSRDLGKDIHLKLEGQEVEIDKSILEGLSDPLNHMVRNAVDHGIEPAAKRIAAGKPAAGTVTLRAYHQAGQVVIEISDNGDGLDGSKVAASALAKGLISREQLQGMADREQMALIFLPGVSTAAKLSDVSGRGVGMDVVKTNLDKLGGKIEIESARGKGTSFRIKLPLTLAIIPSLLVSTGGQRFAIPQVNVGELIRIPALQIAGRIDRAGDAEVLIVRDRLVPLVHLAEMLGLPARDGEARALNVVLVDTGSFEYGLVVHELHDTVEIVVKPLGRHFQGLRDYAGATILGDGRVAVILDVAGLAERAGLSFTKAHSLSLQENSEATQRADIHSLLLFENAPGEACAVPIELVSRIERIQPEQVQYLGGKRTMQYRGACMPLVTLRDSAAVGELTADQSWVVIVFGIGNHPVGLLAAEPLDMFETELDIDGVTLRQPGIAGSAIFKDRTTLILNIFELAKELRPDVETQAAGVAGSSEQPNTRRTVLVAEDSDFFRGQIQHLVEAVGYRVLAAADGQAAWELLDQNASSIALVATDVEMPRLDGLSLTRRIRADGRFDKLPVIALSSLAGEEEIAKGMAAGVNEYQIKLDPEELLDGIRRAIGVEINSKQSQR